MARCVRARPGTEVEMRDIPEKHSQAGRPLGKCAGWLGREPGLTEEDFEPEPLKFE